VCFNILCNVVCPPFYSSKGGTYKGAEPRHVGSEAKRREYLEQLTLVARAISLRPDNRSLRSIGVQRKLHWIRTSDDDRGACNSIVTPPALGVDKHTTCGMVSSTSASRAVGRIKC
jgi:hypothetical protein